MVNGNPYLSPLQVKPLEDQVRQLMREHRALTAKGFWSAEDRSADKQFMASRMAILTEDFTRQVIDVGFYLARRRLPRGKQCAFSVAQDVAQDVGREIQPGAVIVASYLAGFPTKFGAPGA